MIDSRPVYPPEYDAPDAPDRCIVCGRFLAQTNNTGVCSATCATTALERSRAEADALAADLAAETALVDAWLDKCCMCGSDRPREDQGAGWPQCPDCGAI